MSSERPTLAAAREVLRARFAFPDFRPGQERAVTSVLAGRDTLVVLPTGGDQQGRCAGQCDRGTQQAEDRLGAGRCRAGREPTAQDAQVRGRSEQPAPNTVDGVHDTDVTGACHRGSLVIREEKDVVTTGSCSA